MNEALTMVDTAKIVPHPDNPRSNVGDVTELAKSIETNGIMQNLTVIPGEKKGEYMALIGHRRLAAAKMANIKKVPCRVIEGLSHREQISIMLEENMQRNDLTIQEQARGFQMMLDLGETEETIAEKTGFSRSTVRHRLNIAKLDQEILGNLTESNDYQLTLTDLYELEKIPDIETRNTILARAHENNSVKYQVSVELQNIKRQAIYEAVKAAVLSIEPKAKEEKYISYYLGNDYEMLLRIDIDEEDQPEEIVINLPDEYKEIIYGMNYRNIFVYAKVKVEKAAETDADRKRKEIDKKRKQIRAIEIAMGKDRREFLLAVIDGKYKCAEDLKEELWKLIVQEGAFVGTSNLIEALTGKHQYEMHGKELQESIKKSYELPIQLQMLICYTKTFDHEMRTYYTVNYPLNYHSEHGDRLQQLYWILGKYGLTLTDPDQIAILNGASELYDGIYEGTN